MKIPLVLFSTLLAFTAPWGFGQASSKTTIFYEKNAQIELISPQGIRVFIDVWDPQGISAPVTDTDILLTTHGHPDHLNASFAREFKGQQLLVRSGKIQQGDVTIESIPSAHNEGDPFVAKSGSNYLFIISVGDLRVIHMGDIGQNALTPEQLAALGKPDILVTQFENGYSAMNASNRKGFRLAEQLSPRLILPTHNSLDAAEIAMSKWRCLATDKSSIQVNSASLGAETQILFMGNTSASYADKTKALPCLW